MATKSYGDRPKSFAEQADEEEAKLDQYMNQYMMERMGGDPGMGQGGKEIAAGGGETALTMGSNIASMPQAGFAGMMTAATPEEKRPKGLRIDGQWYPSLMGDTPITPGESVERSMGKTTYMPKSEAGKRALGGIGNVMNEIGEFLMPVREGYQEGANALGISPEVAAIPWVAAGLAAESIPGKRGVSTASRVGKYAKMVDDVVDSDLLRVAEKYDHNVTRAVQAAAAGQPMPAATIPKPRVEVGSPEAKQMMNEPVGSRGPGGPGGPGGPELHKDVWSEVNKYGVNNNVEVQMGLGNLERKYFYPHGTDPADALRQAQVEFKKLYEGTPNPRITGVDSPSGPGKRQRGSIEDTGGGKKVAATVATREAAAGDYSTRFSTVKAFNDWKKSTPDSDPSKREIMYEVLDEQRKKVRSGAKERDGRPLGSPKGMSHQKRTVLIKHYADRIDRGIESGIEPGYFYEEARNAINEVAPTKKSRNVLGKQVEQTSTQIGPAGNVEFTVQGREQRNAGVQTSTGIYPNDMRPGFNRISEGGDEFTGYKRDRYGNLITPVQSRDALNESAKMAPNDRWEFRAAGFDGVPGDPKNVAYMDEFRQSALDMVNKRRKERGERALNLEEAQEIHWAVIRAESEGRPLQINRSSDQIGGALDRLEYSHTYEARPGSNADHFPDAPTSYDRPILNTLNKGGRDPLVEAMGGDLQRPVKNSIGAYVDDKGVQSFAPGQTSRSFVGRTETGGIRPESQARINSTEAIRALALAQDAYAGNVFTPISGAKNPKFNGVNVKTEKKPTQEQMVSAVQLAKEINPDMVVVNSTTGVRAWIPGDTSAKAKRAVENFANQLDVDGLATYGKVDSNFDMLDWKGGNATKDVLDVIDNIDGPDFPGIVKNADSAETRAVLGAIADKYEKLKGAGFGTPNQKLIDVLKTWADKGLPAVREMVKKGLAPAGVLAVLSGKQEPSQNALNAGET